MLLIEAALGFGLTAGYHFVTLTVVWCEAANIQHG
jgi:hypothetical protein